MASNISYLHGEFELLIWLQPLPVQEVRGVRAIDELHHEAQMLLTCLPMVEDGGDAMFAAGYRLGRAFKAGGEFRLC